MAEIVQTKWTVLVRLTAADVCAIISCINHRRNYAGQAEEPVGWLNTARHVAAVLEETEYTEH